MTQPEMLVSGATGRTGGAALDALLAMGKRVRALVRTDDARAQALRARGVDIAVGDVSDIDAVRSAMEGVESAYFLHPIRPGIIEATTAWAQAAKEAGVGSLVNMSQISARRETKSHAARDHWLAEQVFNWSGVPTTHLRPTFFADWLIYPHFGKANWKRRRLEFPFGEGRHAPISSSDQGRVIAQVLSDPAPHAGKVYRLQGPMEMNHHEIAAAMSEVLGEELTYASIDIAEFRRRMEEFKFNPFLVQHLGEVALDYQAGIFSGSDNVVEEITGKRAMTVQEFIAANRRVFD